jgi:hypothetical protein
MLRILASAAASLALVAVAVPAEAVPVLTTGNRWASPDYTRAHSRPCETPDSVRCFVDTAVTGDPKPSFSVLKDGAQVFWRFAP